jgi:hypothetical protein
LKWSPNVILQIVTIKVCVTTWAIVIVKSDMVEKLATSPDLAVLLILAQQVTELSILGLFFST